MTVEDVLIDLEELGLEVLSVYAHVSTMTSIIVEVESYCTFKGGLHLRVQDDRHSLRFWVGCHRKDGTILSIFNWPDNVDYIIDFDAALNLDGSNAHLHVAGSGSVIDQEDWPKLLKCLRRMLT